MTYPLQKKMSKNQANLKPTNPHHQSPFYLPHSMFSLFLFFLLSSSMLQITNAIPLVKKLSPNRRNAEIDLNQLRAEHRGQGQAGRVFDLSQGQGQIRGQGQTERYLDKLNRMEYEGEWILYAFRSNFVFFSNSPRVCVSHFCRRDFLFKSKLRGSGKNCKKGKKKASDPFSSYWIRSIFQ